MVIRNQLILFPALSVVVVGAIGAVQSLEKGSKTKRTSLQSSVKKKEEMNLYIGNIIQKYNVFKSQLETFRKEEKKTKIPNLRRINGSKRYAKQILEEIQHFKKTVQKQNDYFLQAYDTDTYDELLRFTKEAETLLLDVINQR